jgi:predicted PurR-regulated permease PerM
MTNGSAATETRRVRRLAAPTPRVALVIAAAVVVGVLLYLGRHALTPFIVGALLIYILDPAVGFVARLHIAGRTMPRGLAVLLVYVVAFFIVIEGLLLLLGPLIGQLLEYVRDLPRLVAALEEALARLGEMYRGLDLPPQIRAYVDELVADLFGGAGEIDFGSLLPIARTIVGTAAGFFGFLIIPIWAFYILRDRVNLTERFDQVMPAEWRRDVWAVLNIIERVVGRWIRAQIVLGLIIGAATYFGLLLLGWLVDPRFGQFAVLLAVLAGLLELLPIIGPILAMIPTLLVALTTSDPVAAVIAVLILYIAVQQVENAVLVPKIQGDAVELHPSVVIFVLIVGAAIAGLPGAILSIPITAAARGVYAYLFARAGELEGVVPPPAAESGDAPPADPAPEQPRSADRTSEPPAKPVRALRRRGPLGKDADRHPE